MIHTLTTSVSRMGVHQGSVFSPLIFIIVLEALSKEFRTGCPWELFYADDLVVSAETPEALREKLLTWKHNFELKGLRVNMRKIKYMDPTWTLWAFPLWCVQERQREPVPTVSGAQAVHIRFIMVAQVLKVSSNFQV